MKRGDQPLEKASSPPSANAIARAPPGCAPALGLIAAVGELVRRTDGRWMIRPPRHCPFVI